MRIAFVLDLEAHTSKNSACRSGAWPNVLHLSLEAASRHGSNHLDRGSVVRPALRSTFRRLFGLEIGARGWRHCVGHADPPECALSPILNA